MDLEENYAWPQRGARLFVDSGSKYEFSHFGWEGGIEPKFDGYMRGYKKAADLLIESAIKTQDISIIDTIIYPVCFLYRQYLELAIKNIYISYSEDNLTEKANVFKNMNHDLIKTWNKIKPYLQEEADDIELDGIEIVEDYIKQFHEFDRSSYTFRYPITKSLTEVINDQKRVNLTELKSRMNELYHFFSGCMGKLDYYKGIKTEIREEFMQFLRSEYSG
jgi:hypothetical protein